MTHDVRVTAVVKGMGAGVGWELGQGLDSILAVDGEAAKD